MAAGVKLSGEFGYNDLYTLLIKKKYVFYKLKGRIEPGALNRMLGNKKVMSYGIVAYQDKDHNKLVDIWY